MARATFVKKARRAVPHAGIKVGDSYYWWKFRTGGRGGAKHFSKERPKQSQLTQSEFWSAIYQLQERNAPYDLDDLESEVDDIRQELENIRDETQGKLDNMPDGLRDGDSGSTLQERIDACEEAMNELESVDFTFDEPDTSDMEEGEAEDAINTARQDRMSEIWDEVMSHLDLSCS